jgi:hypothetical protein
MSKSRLISRSIIPFSLLFLSFTLVLSLSLPFYFVKSTAIDSNTSVESLKYQYNNLEGKEVVSALDIYTKDGWKGSSRNSIKDLVVFTKNNEGDAGKKPSLSILLGSVSSKELANYKSCFASINIEKVADSSWYSALISGKNYYLSSSAGGVVIDYKVSQKDIDSLETAGGRSDFYSSTDGNMDSGLEIPVLGATYKACFSKDYKNTVGNDQFVISSMDVSPLDVVSVLDRSNIAGYKGTLSEKALEPQKIATQESTVEIKKEVLSVRDEKLSASKSPAFVYVVVGIMITSTFGILLLVYFTRLNKK